MIDDKILNEFFGKSVANKLSIFKDSITWELIEQSSGYLQSIWQPMLPHQEAF
jgi:hypothetical protein